MAAMKILMYAPIFPPLIGGPSTQCYHLCRTLRAHGEQPIVLTVGERFERTDPDGYPVYRYPWRYTGTPLDKAIRWAVFPWYFMRVLRIEGPDIVHCHSVSILSFVAGFISRRRGIPCVIKFAGDWVWETISTHGVRAKDFEELYGQSFFPRVLFAVERRGLRLFDGIWAPSEFRARNVRRLLGEEAPVRVIYNALDLPAGGMREEQATDPFVVVSANRFIPHKRIPFMIETFARMHAPDAHLVLIGDGQPAIEEETRHLVERLGIANRVTFTGRLWGETVYTQFKKASVYLSTSLEEGFPNVFVEAMRFGLPIITSDVGGVSEMVEEGATGFLVAPERDEQLVDRLDQLAQDRLMRNAMAGRAFERSKRYDLNTVLPQFMELYGAAKARAQSRS